MIPYLYIYICVCIIYDTNNMIPVWYTMISCYAKYDQITLDRAAGAEWFPLQEPKACWTSRRRVIVPTWMSAWKRWLACSAVISAECQAYYFKDLQSHSQSMRIHENSWISRSIQRRLPAKPSPIHLNRVRRSKVSLWRRYAKNIYSKSCDLPSNRCRSFLLILLHVWLIVGLELISCWLNPCIPNYPNVMISSWFSCPNPPNSSLSVSSGIQLLGRKGEQLTQAIQSAIRGATQWSPQHVENQMAKSLARNFIHKNRNTFNILSTNSILPSEVPLEKRLFLTSGGGTIFSDVKSTLKTSHCRCWIWAGLPRMVDMKTRVGWCSTHAPVHGMQWQASAGLFTHKYERLEKPMEVRSTECFYRFKILWYKLITISVVNPAFSFLCFKSLVRALSQ